MLRRLIRTIANSVAFVLVVPVVLIYRTQSLLIGPDRAFPFWSQAFSLVPGTLGTILRRAFYRLVLRQCSGDVLVGFGTIFSGPGVRLGPGVYVGPFSVLGEVDIEADVLIASHVSIMNGSRQHGTARIDLPIRHQPGCLMPVTIGRGCWIGERSVVMADVGRDAIVGAGSVVVHSVPAYAIVAGVPARVLRDRREGNGETARAENPGASDSPSLEAPQ